MPIPKEPKDEHPVERKPLSLPGGHDKVLLYSCYAPCSGDVMEAMLASGINYTIFIYIPNEITDRFFRFIRGVRH